MKKSTKSARGRPVGMGKADKYFGKTFNSLVELRMRASVAAALAEISLVPHPWPKTAFQRLVAGISKAISLYTQANALVTGLSSGKDPAPPKALDSMMFVTLVYESVEDSLSEGNPSLAENPNASSIKLTVPAEKIASYSSVDVGDMTLSIYLDRNVPKHVSNALDHNIRSQLIEAGLALGLDDFRPREDWKSRPPSSRNEILWDVRIRMSVFVALFLDLYREDFLFPDPFLVFLLEPCRLGRASLKRHQTHVRSGFLGYSYLIDKGQLGYLTENVPDINPIDLEGEMALPFPAGICGSVYLQGGDSTPVLADQVIHTYENANKGISTVERMMLKDRILLELPIHVADIEELSPDGPELILAIAIPVPTPQSARLRGDNIGPTTPQNPIKGDTQETDAELIERLSCSPDPTIFKSGEIQILREVSRRLVNEFVRTPVSLMPNDDELLGKSSVMREAISDAKILARSKRPILILGPAGSGKTLLAKKIHDWIINRSGDLRITSGASFSEELGRSEIFGYMKGSHSTAKEDTPGILEEIDGGTLFIDDFDALPPDVQAMLLSVMEGGEFRRVGENGGNPRLANVRFILATNGNLNDLVDNGMRRDFLTRFVGYVAVPPLDRRRQDIPDLVRYFIRTFVADQLDTFPELTIHTRQEVLDILSGNDWSDGEVRALRYVVELACTKLLVETSENPSNKKKPRRLILGQREVDWALGVQPSRARYVPLEIVNTPLPQEGEINANAAALGAGFEYSSFTHAQNELHLAMSNIRSFCHDRANLSGHDIALTSSATAACEAGVLALAPEADIVIYTDLAHPCVEKAIQSVSRNISAQRRGEFVPMKVKLRDLVKPGINAAKLAKGITEAIHETAKNQRAIVVLEHVAYEEGLRLPVDAVCEELNNAPHQLLIDAAQSIGVWRPQNLLTAHLFGCFHKFVGGPAGTGFLALANWSERLPYSIGYTIHPEKSLDFPTTDIRKWELTSLAINRLVERFNKPEKVEDEAYRFIKSFRDHVKPFRGTLDDVTDHELLSHIIAVNLPSAQQAQSVVDQLAQHSIWVQRLRNKVRVSMGARSNLADARRIGSVLRLAAQSAAQ